MPWTSDLRRDLAEAERVRHPAYPDLEAIGRGRRRLGDEAGAREAFRPARGSGPRSSSGVAALIAGLRLHLAGDQDAARPLLQVAIAAGPDPGLGPAAAHRGPRGRASRPSCAPGLEVHARQDVPGEGLVRTAPEEVELPVLPSVAGVAEAVGDRLAADRPELVEARRRAVGRAV